MHENALAAALRRAVPDEVAPLRSIAFRHGDLLAEKDAPIDSVFFLTAGLVSIVVPLRGGESIESAMVGPGGIIGGAVAFGSRLHVSTAFAQIGGRGWVMKASDFTALVRRDPEIEALLIANEQYLLAQAQQTAACNARHHIPQRIASWLLRASDACGDTELHLTQEYLAQMLGVQRASVSVIAAQLQEAGLIQYRRGRVSIADRHALMQRSCECYGTLHLLKKRLSPPHEGHADADGRVESADRAHKVEHPSGIWS